MKTSHGYLDTIAEFDHLKNIDVVVIHVEVMALVEKAHSSLQSRGNFNKRDYHKRSLLYYAAIGNYTNLLLYLLKSKQNVDSRDHWGRTPLSYAAEYGSLAVAKVLVAQGAKINALDYEGGTPLEWLLEAVNPKITNIAATEAYLREIGAKKVKLRGIKSA